LLRRRLYRGDAHHRNGLNDCTAVLYGSRSVSINSRRSHSGAAFFLARDGVRCSLRHCRGPGKDDMLRVVWLGLMMLFVIDVACAQYSPPLPRVFIVHGVGRTCDSIGALDRALSAENAGYFAGWNAGDYDAAAAWAGACVVRGYQYFGPARVARLRAYQNKISTTELERQSLDRERKDLERQREDLERERAELTQAQIKLAADQEKLRAASVKVKIVAAKPKPVTPKSTAESDLIEHGSYTNADGVTVHSPAHTSDGSVPVGATAECGDGSYSFSQHHSGTCSHHGGVAAWLD
jgi:FtsZ-binding cell division protein ZapB